MRDVTALARRYRLDANTGTEGSPTWVQVMGILELTPPKIGGTIQKSMDYEDAGWQGNQRTGLDWQVEFTVRRKLSTAGAYDPGQESLRAKRLGVGTAALAQVRVYERAGGTGTEAYLGTGVVEWEDEKGTADDTASAKCTITGDGALTEITNPAS